MARWTASAKWAAGPALDGQRDMPLALRLSEGLGLTRHSEGFSLGTRMPPCDIRVTVVFKHSLLYALNDGCLVWNSLGLKLTCPLGRVVHKIDWLRVSSNQRFAEPYDVLAALLGEFRMRFGPAEFRNVMDLFFKPVCLAGYGRQDVLVCHGGRIGETFASIRQKAERCNGDDENYTDDDSFHVWTDEL